MNAGKALLAGVVGAVVMSILLAMGRMMGMSANLEMMLGTMLGIAPGPTTWIIGFITHLMMGGLIALVYGAGFNYLAHRAGWGVGVAFSIVHIVIAGIVMGVMPMMHPMVPEQMNAPGAFMSNLGLMGIVAFVMLHAIYGAIVGAMYGPVQHPTAFRTRAQA